MHQAHQEPVTQIRMFAQCPLFPPFILTSSAMTCSNERAGHTGHLYYFLLDAAANIPPPSLNNPLFFSTGLRSLYLCLAIYPLRTLWGAELASCFHHIQLISIAWCIQRYIMLQKWGKFGVLYQPCNRPCNWGPLINESGEGEGVWMGENTQIWGNYVVHR